MVAETWALKTPTVRMNMEMRGHCRLEAKLGLPWQGSSSFDNIGACNDMAS